MRHVPRLMSMLDREPRSPNYGAFDRSYWAWRFRDCPLTMLQAAVVPVAQLWSSPLAGHELYRNPRMLEWIAGALEAICRMQSENGSFNLWGPHTAHPGVGLAMALVACRTLHSVGEDLDPRLVARLRRMVERACRFALEHEEDYAFISNHQALYALALLRAGELLDCAAYQQRAEQIIGRIIAEQSVDGWYAEYGGPDPGYESLGISYLASYWTRARAARLLESLERSVKFYAHCVHPDGSVGGVYGSRHTKLYFPAGFEALSGEIPLAAAVARYMRERLERGNVVTLAAVDAENLAVLAGNYLDAAMTNLPPNGPLPPLPCEALEGVRNFSASGITVAGTPHYYAVVNAAKGGVCRAFDKQRGRLAYEDAGYLVRADRRLWTSQRLCSEPRPAAAPANEAVAFAPFTAVRPEAQTAVKFLLFRLASMTLFRNVWLGAWLQRQIIRRLITVSQPGPLRLERRVLFTPDEILFSDRIKLERPMDVEGVELERAFTGIHMGSARYYHPSDAEETPLPDTRGIAHELETRRAAICEYRLRFSSAAKPELLAGARPGRSEEARTEGTLTRL